MRTYLRWKPNLLTSFSLVGAIITAIIAIFFAWNLERRLEQNALWQEANSAADQVSLVLSPTLREEDFSEALEPERYDAIDAVIRRDILHAHIVRVKIWSLEGQLVYSDERSLAGQFFPVSDELEEAITGEMAMEVSSLDKTENVSERELYQRLLEIYLPIRLQGKEEIVGVYEIYHDLAVLDPVIADMRRFIWVSVVVGFLILYGSLFTLVRNASRELVKRNEENKHLFELEQIRRTELSALYDLSRVLADAYDFDSILSLVSKYAVETVHVTFSLVALLEDDEFVVRAGYPIRAMAHNLGLGKQIKLGFNPSFPRVLELNAPTLISVDNPGLSESEREMLFMGLAKTICIVPLRSGNRALGLLMFGEARSEEREPFTADKLRLARSIGDQAASALYRVELFNQLEDSYVETALALANAVDAKDTYTADHAQHLASMAQAIGVKMGMSEIELKSLQFGAILHDIGKIGVPDAILQKPDRLDQEEWVQMREHPSIGARILKPVPRLAQAALIVRHHHERYDGKGYPDGFAGEEIPLGARILTVVDSYSAIIDERVYKKRRSHEEAVMELKMHAGTQFDPRVVEMFLDLNLG